MTDISRILIVAYEFPPLNTGGTMRPVRMANYFAEQGIKTCVIAGDPSTYEGHIDSSLYDLVDSRVEVLRAKLGPPASPLWRRLVTSGYVGKADEIFGRWKGQALPLIREAIGRFKPDVLLMTVPPFSLSELAGQLGREFEIPLLVDFRDAWSQWVLTPYASYFHYLHRLWCERKLLRTAAMVTVTSQVTLRDLVRLHGRTAEQKLVYAPNSFDEFLSEPFTNISLESGRVSLLYLGTFYYNKAWQRLFEIPWYRKKVHQWFQYSPRLEDWSYRGPERLLKIFDAFLGLDERHQCVQMVFAGKKPDWWESALFSDRLKSNCVHLGSVPKSEALELLKEADGLILTSNKVVGGADYSIAGKTYEYLAVQKPILGVVCEGAQKDFLLASGAALCLEPDETDDSARRMADLIDGTRPLEPNRQFVESHLTSQVLDELLGQMNERLAKS